MTFGLMLRASIVCLGLLAGSNAQAQSWQMNTQSLALKSGESTEVSDLYWVVNCRSQLTTTPEVTILDGPPGVTATVTEAMVTPRFQQCPKPVAGGKLKVTAGKIEDQSNSIMTIRIRYATRDGVRDKSMTFTVALFP
jgi:hypothetical protein